VQKSTIREYSKILTLSKNEVVEDRY
jgi:hypothetical protein